MRQPRAGESRTKLKSVFSRPLLSEIGINIRQEERDGHKKAQKSQNLFPRLLWLFLFTSNQGECNEGNYAEFFYRGNQRHDTFGTIAYPSTRPEQWRARTA